MADAPETVLDALDLLATEGYADDFTFEGGQVRCGACGGLHSPDQLVVDRQFRFEGASDPDDEAIVLGLRCDGCGARGRLSAAYGPSMDPEVADALRHLTTRSGAADPE